MSEIFPKKNKLCFVCKKPIAYDRIFCSKECKSKSQIKRITLTCCGCGKSLRILPCLKRKANFCSLDCYRETTRREEIRNCKVCGKKFVATGSQVRKGFGIYCSRKCQYKTYPEKIEKICVICKKHFQVWPSHVWHTKFCSKKCRDDSMRDYVSSVCRRCGKNFELPRSDLNRGRGNFCTYKCFLHYRGPSTLEEKMERALKLAKIKFEREVKFKRFHVDFLVQRFNSIIECDGEYWHLRPGIADRDKRKEELLTSLGYKVLRFSGRMMDDLTERQLASKVLANFNGR